MQSQPTTAPRTAAVHGTVADGFEAVRDVFAAVVAEDPDPGAQLAVHHHGRRVVDLWAGEGVTGESLHALYSSAKGAAHLVTALLVQEGVLEPDRPVRAYWPEFAAEGKDGLTLRDLLSHRAGLIGADGGLTTGELADDRALAGRLAAQRPYWRPGTGYGYHAFTMGALSGEVVRRATGATLQEVYAERIREPYALDFHLGLPEALEPRYVPVRPLTGDEQERSAAGTPAPDSLTGIAFNLHADPAPGELTAYLADFANSRAVRALGPASSGGVGNARGLAGMYAAAIGGLLTPATLAAFTTPHSPGTDLVTGESDHFLLGFEAQARRYPELGPDAFGHSGAVGAQSFSDPRSGIAYAYTRRRFSFGGGGGAPENRRLVAAVIRAAGAAGR
jgi:CubicO group peptidase (beta-lactamase class C family)